MTKLLKVAALAGAVTACATSAPPTGLIVPPNDGVPVHGSTGGRECSNQGLDQFRGRAATSEVGSEILRLSGARIIRWAPPGTMMTMEFNSERVTVHLDSANRITRAICG